MTTEYVICEICGSKFRQITPAHVKLHNITMFEYRINFPDSVLVCDDLLQKKRETNLRKYGVEYDFQSEEVKDKIKKTNLERYGVEYPAQSKEIMDKKTLTDIERYGVKNVSQSDIIKQKKINTSIEHFGVENPMQSKEIYSKHVETIFNKYGVVNINQTEDGRIRVSCQRRGIDIKDWNGFISFDPYCEKFNLTKKKEVREKYNNCDYLTGIHRDICNTVGDKIQELDVHHVDFNKMQGCEGHKWLLVPVSRKHNGMFNKDRPFWERLIKYSLEYDKEYYNELVV